MWRLIAVSAVFVAVSGTASAQCEVSSTVRELLNELPFQHRMIESTEKRATQQAAFAKALAEHPDDYFVLRAQMSTMDSAEERVKWAASLRAQHPDSPLYALLDAQALLGKDTPEAVRRLEALKALHPEMSQQYLVLADLFQTGKLRDSARAQQALDSYERLCPRSTAISFLNAVLQTSSPDLAARTATALRTTLMADADPIQHDKWEALWRLEFKVRPVSEHPAVRRRIAEDLARFEKSDERKTAEWLAFLGNGYESLGDHPAVLRLNDEIAANFPQSDEAKRVVQQRWHDEHPTPTGPSNKAYTRELLTAVREWHKQWPNDPTFAQEIFTAVNDLPDCTTEEVAQAADDLLGTYSDGADAAWPILALQVADAYVKHQIRLDDVPKLVREGAHQYAEREARNGIDDRMADRTQEMMRSSPQSIHIWELRILLDYYALTKQLPEVKAVEAELETIEITKSTPKAALLSMRAKAAEIEGRKIDALALYRGAIAARAIKPPEENDKMLEKAKQLWRELGGSPELYAMLGETPQLAEVTDQRWERPKKQIPAFSVTDLEGNIWKLASLEGKILLINIWATWCAPCVAEHRELQKLYEATKDHGDVVVLSFNVDRDLGKVAPYIAQHHYAFPVILAKDVVDSVEPSMGLPRNWLVDAKGKLQWEQFGYGPNQRWETMITTKIGEVREGAQ